MPCEVLQMDPLTIGERFLFSVRISDTTETFSGKSVTLVLDWNGPTRKRLQFTASGCTVFTPSGSSSDSIAATLTESNKRITWERNEAFVTANMPEGYYSGVLFWGSSATEENVLARFIWPVQAMTWGAPA